MKKSTLFLFIQFSKHSTAKFLSGVELCNSHMAFMQWWQMCMLPAFVLQSGFISLSTTNVTGNETTA
jgi:hypothetical protein